jgi:hypothetical protein
VESNGCRPSVMAIPHLKLLLLIPSGSTRNTQVGGENELE